MYIPDEIRKCVVFVGICDASGSSRVAATAFFVYMPFEHNARPYSFTYCVTARHVIESIANKIKHSGHMFLRMNLNEGGTRDFRVEMDNWRFHEDTTFDAAVMPFVIDQVACDHKAYPVDGFLTSELSERDQIGIGSDLFFVGLFKRHVPASKNVPILRVGNIAAMPEEPVHSGRGQAMLYLVESRSIGGLSGSPVFIYKTPLMAQNNDGQKKAIPLPTRNNLMGLIHGHFDEEGGGEKINMGIAVVTPIQVVADILDYNDFKGPREAQRAEIEALGDKRL